MPLSPELRAMPEIIGKFTKSGLTKDLISALIKGEKGRDIISDSKRLVKELSGKNLVVIEGIENISKQTGCLVVFNHPNMDVLLPAILNLIVEVNNLGGKQPKLLMGGEIPLLSKFNDTYPLPGSIALIKSFHQLYSDNIISVPISKTRKDYNFGRLVALRKTIQAIREGEMVLVAPEGHVEMNNNISSVDTFHAGSGGMAIIAGKNNLPTVPVGIWGNREKIRLSIGKPFILKTDDKDEAVVFLMEKIAHQLPVELRGPFA